MCLIIIIIIIIIVCIRGFKKIIIIIITSCKPLLVRDSAGLVTIKSNALLLVTFLVRAIQMYIYTYLLTYCELKLLHDHSNILHNAHYACLASTTSLAVVWNSS